MRGIGCCGVIQGIETFSSDHCIRLCPVNNLMIFLGSAFGGKVPPKVAVFGWPSLRKNLTIDNLRKRGLIIVDWCFMCIRNGEFVDHLTLHCEVAKFLWC